MATDTDRREVARRLREFSRNTWPLTVGGNSATIRYAISDIVFGDQKYHSGIDLLDRLADLIELSGYGCVPGECPLNVRHDNDRIDRDALLALADEMDERAPYGWYSGERDSLRDYARRIREALGVES